MLDLRSVASDFLARYLALVWPLRLALAVPAFLLWTLEINAWTAAPRELILLNGAHAGFWGGLFLCSVWPGLRAVSASPLKELTQVVKLKRTLSHSALHLRKKGGV